VGRLCSERLGAWSCEDVVGLLRGSATLASSSYLGVHSSFRSLYPHHFTILTSLEPLLLKSYPVVNFLLIVFSIYPTPQPPTPNTRRADHP